MGSFRWLGGITKDGGFMLVGWKRLDESFVKINVDGSSSQVTKQAGIGYVARSHLGKWIKGEAHNLDLVSSLKAEIPTIFYGLQLA